MASISCITDLIFDTNFRFIDSVYLTNRSVNFSEVKAARCILKEGRYVIKSVFDYNDQVYINHYAIPEGHGMKFHCAADFKIADAKTYSFRFCETDMVPEQKLREVMAQTMTPGKLVRITTDAPIELFKELATVRITFWNFRLNTFVAKLKFSFPKAVGDEWFDCYMKYRAQIAE